jgi:hypothetical protein
LFADHINKWLETALDFGIAERDFWEMTFAELNRAFESKKRLNKIQEQKQASFDYILADLIGKSVARVYNSANKLPKLNEAYPSLFDDKEIKEKEQERKNNLSALRFKQFALAHNTKFKEASK